MDASCTASNALCGYVPDLISNVEKQKYDVVLKDTTVDGIQFVPPHYAFSSKLVNGKECSLILAASLLAHEMIHQFNFEHENEGSIKWLDVAYNRPYDYHGENFEKWMNILNNEHGLNIKKFGIGKISDLSAEAYQALKDFAGQDYNKLNEEDITYGHKVLKHTKDFSAFTEFM